MIGPTLAEATALHEAVRAVASGLLRDVLDHHRPVEATWGGAVCGGCDLGPHPEDLPDWPCSTWTMIADGAAVPRGTVTS